MVGGQIFLHNELTGSSSDTSNNNDNSSPQKSKDIESKYLIQVIGNNLKSIPLVIAASNNSNYTGGNNSTWTNISNQLKKEYVGVLEFNFNSLNGEFCKTKFEKFMVDVVPDSVFMNDTSARFLNIDRFNRLC